MSCSESQLWVVSQSTSAAKSAEKSSSIFGYAFSGKPGGVLFDMPPAPPVSPAPTVVLDTNTVLDWLVFRNACMAPVVAALESSTLHWLACTAMREELRRTLAYRSLAKWQPDSQHALATFDHHARLLPMPAAAPQHLRCSDPDDQVFLDLALAHKARWLITHDGALLRMARRVRPLGLLITAPKHWLGPASPS